MAKQGHVVYIDSDPANVIGLFFQQNFPGGKTSFQAATDYAASLVGTSGPIPSEVKVASIDSYTLTNPQIITF